MTLLKAAIEAADLTRPIIGIENRTAQEVFDIMCDRIRTAPPAPALPEGNRIVRHKKRDSTYEVVAEEAEGQVSTGDEVQDNFTGDLVITRPVYDGVKLTFYRSLEDGKMWWRFPDEMVDGRFEEAAAPEPPANSQGSLDGSAEPMMTDEEIAEFIKENGQPEDTFPYLRVPLTPAADPVKARLVEALRRARDEIRRYSYIESATSKAFIDDYNERMVPIDAAIAAADAEENTNKG